MTAPKPSARTYVLFIYGTLLPGEPSHALLAGARPLGPAITTASYDLVDLGPHPGLIAGGTTAVTGELYEVAPAVLAAIDVHEGHPVLFKRAAVSLAGGREAEAYLLEMDQARGRRRIRGGDWRARFVKASPVGAPRARDGAFARWSRNRTR